MTSDVSTIPVSEYEEYIYNLTLTGDENVIGIAKLEPVDDNVSELDSGLIRKALYFMFKRHPLFRANIIETVEDEAESKFKYYFKIHDESSRHQDDMQFEYCELNDQSLVVDELELFITKMFDYKNKCLLWKFKLISCIDGDSGKRSYVLALVLPLYITDGFNVTALCFEICNIINSLLKNTCCEEMCVKLGLTDNMHVALEKQNLYNDTVKIEVEKLINYEKIINFNLPYLFKASSEIKKAKMNLLKLDAELTSLIIKQSKIRKTRLTGYLIAVGLQALKQLFNESNIEIQRDFSCIVPANLRIRLKPEVDFSDMRFLVVLTSLNLFYPSIDLENVTAEKIWSNANYINEAIAEKTKFQNGSLLQYSHNFKFTRNANKLFESMKNESISASKITSEMNRYSFCDFLVSNLGTHVSDRKKLINEPYKLTEVYHGDSITSNPNNFAVIMLHVCTLDNQLMFQLSVNRNIFTSEYADRFMSIYKSILEMSV